MTTLIGSDPVGVIIFGIFLAIGLIRLVLWLIVPPRWQDLDSGTKSGDPLLYFLSGSTRHH
jgi:hypothetical protein